MGTMLTAVERPVTSDETPTATPAPVDGLERQSLFGLGFVSEASVERVVSSALSFVGAAETSDAAVPVIFTPNADIVVRMDHDPSGPESLLARRARFILPDSQAVVFASRLLGAPLAGRLPGSSVFTAMWKAYESDDVVVIGPSEEVARRLGDERPGSTYVVPPFYEGGGDAERQVLYDLGQQILRDEPGLVVVGLSSVKSAVLATYLVDNVLPLMERKPLILLCGGGLEMHVGLRSRAPRWLQSIGFEWLYRFAQEPRRLFRRYFIDDMQFFAVVGRSWRGAP